MLDLFSGIGGFSLAAKWVFEEKIEIVRFVEKDIYAQKILRKNFPGVTIYDEIENFKGNEFRETIDIISGGFPCQTFSIAGKKKANYSLWKEMYRIINEIKPTFIIIENVANIINLGYEQVLSDLENSAYKSETFLLPAYAFGFPHKRERLFTIAYPNSIRFNQNEIQPEIFEKKIHQTSGWKSGRMDGLSSESIFESRTRGENDGVPTEMDRVRVKLLGNAVIPQIALIFFLTIKELLLNHERF